MAIYECINNIFLYINECFQYFVRWMVFCKVFHLTQIHGTVSHLPIEPRSQKIVWSDICVYNESRLFVDISVECFFLHSSLLDGIDVELNFAQNKKSFEF